MSHSPFARAFIMSTCVAGAVFAASSFPLAFSKAKVVDIELQNQPVFSSEIRDLAAPYLALSGSFSVAIGFGVFGMLGWQTANRKLSKIASESSNLAHDLAIHHAELERIKFSEARLQGQHLTSFLQPAGAPAMDQTPRSALPVGVAEVPPTELAAPVSMRHQPVAASDYHPAVQMATQVQSDSEETELKSDVLSSLLLQLNQLSQQVEELQSRQTSGLAA